MRGVGNVALFDWLMNVLVSDYFVPVAGSLLLVALWMTGTHETRPQNQITTMIAAGGIGGANAITTIINGIVDRPRPFVGNDLTLLFYAPTDPSFPSNTASVGFALATAVFLRHRRLGGVLYALAFCWGFARVYAGVHYPTDVLGGGCCRSRRCACGSRPVPPALVRATLCAALAAARVRGIAAADQPSAMLPR